MKYIGILLYTHWVSERFWKAKVNIFIAEKKAIKITAVTIWQLLWVELVKSTEVIQKWNIALRFGGSVMAVQDWHATICPE